MEPTKPSQAPDALQFLDDEIRGGVFPLPPDDAGVPEITREELGRWLSRDASFGDRRAIKDVLARHFEAVMHVARIAWGRKVYAQSVRERQERKAELLAALRKVEPLAVEACWQAAEFVRDAIAVTEATPPQPARRGGRPGNHREALDRLLRRRGLGKEERLTVLRILGTK